MRIKKGKTLLIGLLTGFFSGLLGIGGGIVMIPLMTKMLGFSQRQAHGTSLLAIVLGGWWGLGLITLTDILITWRREAHLGWEPSIAAFNPSGS